MAQGDPRGQYQGGLIPQLGKVVETVIEHVR